MNMNMGGEPKPEEKPVVESNVETPHVNPYMEREEQEKADEYKLELEKWQADIDAKVAKMRAEGTDEEAIELFIEYSPKPVLKIESGPEKEKREVEKALTDFEKNHSLEYLNSIEILTPELVKLFTLNPEKESDQIESMLANIPQEDVEKYRARAAAKKDMLVIAALMKNLYGKDFYTEGSYQKLSNVLGTINKGRITRDLQNNIGVYSK